MQPPELNAFNDIVVIGAGIVGLSVALQLHLDGYKVTVIDQSPPMVGCSAGNAGYLSQANIFPPATPDLLLKMPKLLMDKQGPLVIKPSYFGKMVPWALRAVSTLKPAPYAKTVNALSSLITRSQDSLSNLAGQANAAHLLTKEGGLIAFRTQSAFTARQKALPIWRDHGIDVTTLSREETLGLEPALAPDTVGSIHFKNSGRCSDPQGLGLLYAQHLAKGGARFIRDKVISIKQAEMGGWKVAMTTQNLHTPKVVVCAGHASDELLAGFGYRKALVSERGYHLMLPSSGISLTRPVVFGEPYFAATPMLHGLRLAGTAEFCSASAPPNMDRSYMLGNLAKQYLPGLNLEGAEPWMGVRPSLPDGLPAIGQIERSAGFFYAFGHGHNGLMTSAITAKCVSELISARQTTVDITPFDLKRFG
ncbi:FAD-binding oxidoreductase [Pseudomonas sp. PDM26]|uniref:NAD(P)/FAD-dependent oxidoreductase n=1 Tax=Pseudomonas sp. PDM26 TaxID=2854766 RepID=UPI001C463DFA|nr:FAD-dependent oxidoreductase [Pseudomonas sp. PDM26]MBV7547378.1 FAD-binding oxidoreductase [Pseudomonas sp. PDM26]